MKNKHLLFWLTLGSLLLGILVLVFTIICSANETIEFHKQYCIILLPFMIYLIVQFIVNYSDLTDSQENN